MYFMFLPHATARHLHIGTIIDDWDDDDDDGDGDDDDDVDESVYGWGTEKIEEKKTPTDVGDDPRFLHVRDVRSTHSWFLLFYMFFLLTHV